MTGRSYVVYGPLALGATTVMFEGTPNYPAPDRFWEVVERFRVSMFYNAPTAIRAMRREGRAWAERRDLGSLRLLGTVGEPINPKAWIWYPTVIGKNRCPIVDTWWQTETGGIPHDSFARCHPHQAGLGNPSFLRCRAHDHQKGRHPMPAQRGGYLVIKKPWPGIMPTVYGDHERFWQMYFSQYQGLYFTGDGARKDEDGYFGLMGRVDDVINTSGHRLGTAEMESTLVSHAAVTEAAVVGFPHDIKGEGIAAYVILRDRYAPGPQLHMELVSYVRRVIGPIATPDNSRLRPAKPAV